MKILDIEYNLQMAEERGIVNFVAGWGKSVIRGGAIGGLAGLIFSTTSGIVFPESKEYFDYSLITDTSIAMGGLFYFITYLGRYLNRIEQEEN